MFRVGGDRILLQEFGQNRALLLGRGLAVFLDELHGTGRRQFQDSGEEANLGRVLFPGSWLGGGLGSAGGDAEDTEQDWEKRRDGFHTVGGGGSDD